MTDPTPVSGNPWKLNYKITSVVIVAFVLLMFASNPGEKSFRKFLTEYIKTASGSTVAPETPPVEVAFKRSNYYLFSSYQVSLEGVEQEYLGIFGTFKKY